MCEGRLYDTGKHMWRHGEPATYGARTLIKKLGPCPRCGFPTVEYGGGFSCNNITCENSSFVFELHTPDAFPNWWCKNINVVIDGNSWCAHNDDFENLQESIAGFGNTPQEAVDDYMRQNATELQELLLLMTIPNQ